ncbi:MAG: hypothetical protein KAJ46_02625 [Sedimentisphaerales bacterium]|nr:hypothetical protein [Sedimentisphaerales bacterium]
MVGHGISLSKKVFSLLIISTLVCPLFLGSCRAGANENSDHRKNRSSISAVETIRRDITRTEVQAKPSTNSSNTFFGSVPLNPAIPTPESVIGHNIDEGAVRYPAMVRYLKELAKASPRVRLTSHGMTYEGRILYYLTITSPDNLSRIEEIKADNAKLADPRKLRDSDQANRLLEELPAVAWLTYSIHGDELSSTDAAIYIAWRLAAGDDKVTQKLLNEIVIHIEPLANPDGRERYMSQLEQLSGMISSIDYQAMQHKGLWSRGRGNHYLFDLNRDWLTHTHPETRDRAEVIRSWNPHLLVDSHEMGGYDTYLFEPPREPINLSLSQNSLSWRRRFSVDQAAAFDSYGWSYYTRSWYSEWGSYYTTSWANLSGAIGILYEQARTNAASLKQPTGQETSYRESVHHQIVSSLSNLETLKANRRDILKDFLADRQWAVSKKGPHTKTFLLPPDRDYYRWKRLVDLIARQGIEFEFASSIFNAQNVTDIWGNNLDHLELPQGTLIARPTQPQRRMMFALLAFDPHFSDEFLATERKELENHRDSRLYDVTTSNLSMAYGLNAYWAQEVSPVKTDPAPITPNVKTTSFSDKPDYGYLIDISGSEAYAFLVRLFDHQCRLRLTTKPFQFGGRNYPQGTILLRNHENPDNLPAILKNIASDFNVNISPADTALVEEGLDLGDVEHQLLSAPRVAIASQWPVQSTSFGSVWYLLDYHLRLRNSPFNIQNLAALDLRKYNVLILPASTGLGNILDKKAVEKIKRWIESGGTLIAMGGSAAFVAGKDCGLSSVRLKRDVLDKLSLYEEAVQRENNSRNIKINPDEIWGTKPSASKSDVSPEKSSDKTEKQSKEKSPAQDDIDKLKRDDQWQRIFSPRGAFVKGIVNKEHWLGSGLEDKLPVMVADSYVFMSKHPVATPVRLADNEHLRLSGLLWPEAKERLADSAYVTIESVGRGQVILFAFDPTFRTWLAGSERLFINAVLLGPGMGTSLPVPW